MKPVLQALVLAEHVYCDMSGKKIIAGTFNKCLFGQSENLIQERELPTGEKARMIRGGMQCGSPWAYVSITDVTDGTELSLQFVNLTKNQVLLTKNIRVTCRDRLQTVEIVESLPMLPITEKGVYAFEVVCEGDILGSHRIIAEEIPTNIGEPMATVEYGVENKARAFPVDQDKWLPSKSAYRCHILLTKEEDGSHSAIVLNLPGAGSCGATEEEALCNVREAVSGVIESYLDASEEIPWKDSLASGSDIPDDAKHKWILVHV